LESQNDPRAIIFYHPEVQEIAAELCIRYPHDVRLGNVTWGKFPDGWANIKFEPQENIINRHIAFIMSAHKMNGFLEQICLLIALCRQFAKSVTIVIPYFGPATMERVSVEGELATAEPIFKLMSRPIPPTSGGLPALVLIDIHDIRERFYPADNVTPKLLTASGSILTIIKRNKLTVVFPDEGAYKRFINLAGDVPVVTFIKKREKDSRTLHLGSSYNLKAYGEDHDPWKRFLIWDDLVHTGSTLIECAAALRKTTLQGSCEEIDAYVTHAIFENDSHLRFTNTSRSGISHFYVTNTIPEVAAKLRQHPETFTVLDITDTIAPFIMQRFLPDSLSSSVQPTTDTDIADVYIASESLLKFDAVRYAFSAYTCQISFTPVACQSLVHEQPWGYAETLQGLHNRHNALRLDALKRKHYARIFLISIENGLIPVKTDDGTEIQDQAHVIVEYFEKGSDRHKLSRGSVCCGKISKTLAPGFMAARVEEEDLTFGEYLETIVSDPDEVKQDDWSKTHGGSTKTREEHLRDVIRQILE
jgi:phosphoribosylpyrophosphate synthetase